MTRFSFFVENICKLCTHSVIIIYLHVSLSFSKLTLCVCVLLDSAFFFLAGFYLEHLVKFIKLLPDCKSGMKSMIIYTYYVKYPAH